MIPASGSTHVNIFQNQMTPVPVAAPASTPAAIPPPAASALQAPNPIPPEFYCRELSGAFSVKYPADLPNLQPGVWKRSRGGSAYFARTRPAA